MATTHTVKTAYHGTTDGTAADAITLTQSNPTLTFINRGSGTLYVRVDGTVAVAAADNNYVVPSGFTVAIPIPQPATVLGSNPPGVTASIIAATALAYSVEAL